MVAETPASLGYRMPAEWEAHSATWLAWPHNRDTWPHQLEQVQAIYVQIMAALHGQETVRLFVNDAATAAQVSQILDDTRSTPGYRQVAAAPHRRCLAAR